MFDKQIVRLAFVGTKSLIVCSSLTKELGQEQKYTKFLHQVFHEFSGFFINESLVLQISCQAIALWPSRLEILDKGFMVTFFAKMFPIKFWLKSELHLLQVSANVRPLLRFFS